MDTLVHIGTIIAVVGFFGFIIASSLGFVGGPDDDELAEAIELMAEDDAKLVDVRTQSEYIDNGFPEASNVPLQQLEQRLDELGDPSEPVVVYCRSGNRSAQAAELLEQNGFDDIYDLGAHRTAEKAVEEARKAE